ncbi:hypothetical protein F5X96DRAFT_210481 [Biscogniauxia mediterranea]|nr:hypothetical protein F5X96DRAFT_210481 [Biscogniauxia mediterranea]
MARPSDPRERRIDNLCPVVCCRILLPRIRGRICMAWHSMAWAWYEAWRTEPNRVHRKPARTRGVMVMVVAVAVVVVESLLRSLSDDEDEYVNCSFSFLPCLVSYLSFPSLLMLFFVYNLPTYLPQLNLTISVSPQFFLFLFYSCLFLFFLPSSFATAAYSAMRHHADVRTCSNWTGSMGPSVRFGRHHRHSIRRGGGEKGGRGGKGNPRASISVVTVGTCRIVFPLIRVLMMCCCQNHVPIGRFRHLAPLPLSLLFPRITWETERLW